MVTHEIHFYRKVYGAAFARSGKSQLRTPFRSLHLICIYVRSIVQFRLLGYIALFLIVTVILFTRDRIGNSISLADILSISDAGLVSKVHGSSLLGLFLVGCILLSVLTEGIPRNAVIFSAIIFLLLSSSALYSDYTHVQSTFGPISLFRFLNAIAMGSLITLIWFALYGLFLLISVYGIAYLSEKYTGRRHPDAAVFVMILKLLRECNDNQGLWADFAFKRRAIDTLDKAARIIANDMTRKLVRNTSASSIVVKQQLCKIASGLWSKILWITTPRDDTRQEFIRRLQEFLTEFALGRWDALEKQDLAIDFTKPQINRVLSALRWCLFASWPLMVVYAYNWFGGPTNPLLNDYAKLAALGWLFVSVITLDPLWKDKLSAVRDLISAIRK
jgi:hypothetical protein